MPRLRTSRTALLLSTLLVTVALVYTFREREYISGLAQHSFTYPKDGLQLRDQEPFAVSPIGSAALNDPVLTPVQEAVVDQALKWDADGIVRGWDKINVDLAKVGQADKAVHPILELHERGKKRWESLLKHQSQTLEQATAEYKKRYRRSPPRGFDKWFKFCKENGVKIIDNYDVIERDIGPWWGIDPATFRARRDELEELKFSYKMVLSPNNVSSISGERADNVRPKGQFWLLLPFAQYLDEDVTLYASDHDMGSTFLHEDMWTAALDAAAKGTYLTDDEIAKLEYSKPPDPAVVSPAIFASCNEKSPARSPREPPTNETSFLYDVAYSQYICRNPAIQTLHSAFTWPLRRAANLRPVFHLSRLAVNNEFVMPPLEAYSNITSHDSSDVPVAWEDKMIDKVFWRGKSTGELYSKPDRNRPNYNWRLSQRPRLHLFTQNTEGNADVWVQRSSGWEHEQWNKGQLNERYFDIGLVEKPVGCLDEETCDAMKAEIKFKERVQPSEGAAYKYVIDVDGNGWSSRFFRLLSSGSVVIKSTVFPEWNSEWLTPWVHYVPAQVDLSDLYNIMGFFVGAPDGGEGHDALAKEIAAAARRFTEEHWRYEDMQAYMFRLILEYARLGHDDREAWSYEP